MILTTDWRAASSAGAATTAVARNNGAHIPEVKLESIFIISKERNRDADKKCEASMRF